MFLDHAFGDRRTRARFVEIFRKEPKRGRTLGSAKKIARKSKSRRLKAINKRKATRVTARDAGYLETIVAHIRVCGAYKPKMGQGSKASLSLSDFQKLYRADPFYAWFGLDHPLMYAAHKAAGGMTSIYRQIGKGCENVFRQILRDELGLTATDVTWSYTVPTGKKKPRVLSLDGRIPSAAIKDPVKKERFMNWVLAAAKDLDVADGVAHVLEGAVFEVRQGYKSKDSKRQNGDISNASMAYTKGLLPCVLVLSTQFDNDLYIRYRAAEWAILLGSRDSGQAACLTSTYAFMKEVIGYDWAGFFERNASTLRKEIDKVLDSLLRADK